MLPDRAAWYVLQQEGWPLPPAWYEVEVAGVRRRLPVVAIRPGLRIAVLRLPGDVELVEAAAAALAARLQAALGDALAETVLVGPEAKAVPLVHALARALGHARYVIARKARKPYMQDPVAVPVESVTTPGTQELVLDGPDAAYLRGRSAVLVDDVVSTGGTLRALEALVLGQGARVLARAAVLSEGDGVPGVLDLGRLPVWRD
jgi:adenine phosphoribosyltransferase